MLAATRLAPANRITPTQYSQIIWAILVGAVFFGEYPDGIAFVGMVLVVCFGPVHLLARGAAARLVAAHASVMRNRP